MADNAMELARIADDLEETAEVESKSGGTEITIRTLREHAKTLRLFSAPATPSEGLVDESGWLLERHDPPEYLSYFEGFPTWTTDANKALRFARREDANAFSLVVDDAERITEHLWPQSPSVSPSAVKEDWMQAFLLSAAESCKEQAEQTGEDMTFWADVKNAENFKKCADANGDVDKIRKALNAAHNGAVTQCADIVEAQEESGWKRRIVIKLRTLTIKEQP